MRIALLSDVHSNLHALDAVLARVDEIGVDEVFCLGDVVGYNAHPAECLRLVRERSSVVLVGNHDWGAVHGPDPGTTPNAVAGMQYSRDALDEEALAYLAGLQPTMAVERDGASMYLCHASPVKPMWDYVFPSVGGALYDAIAARTPDDAPYLVAVGHTHLPMLFTSRRDALDSLGDAPASYSLTGLGEREHPLVLVNPGSVGQPRDGDPRAAFAIVETPSLRVTFHRVEYDVKAAAASVLTAGLPGFLAARLARGQ